MLPKLPWSAALAGFTIITAPTFVIIPPMVISTLAKRLLKAPYRRWLPFQTVACMVKKWFGAVMTRMVITLLIV